ncbi:MAG: hypothetical protein ABW221_09755 [Vicinamibacteria bacterium]
MLTALVLAALPLGGPCQRCVVWEARPDEARALVTDSQRLDGLVLQLAGAGSDVAGALEARGALVGQVRTTAGPVAVDVPPPAWVLVRPPADGDDAALAFGLKELASDLRARRSDALVGLEVEPDRLRRLFAQDVRPYVDFVVQQTAADAEGAAVWTRPAGRPASLRALDESVREAGGPVLVPWSGTALVLAWERLQRALGPAAVPVPADAVRCARDGRAVPCETRAFLDARTGAALAWVDAAGGFDTIETAGPAPASAAGIEPAAEALALRAETGHRTGLGLPSRSLVLREPPEEAARFGAALEVTAERTLTAAEVLSRHRAAERRQRLAVRQSIATGSTTATFTLPGLSAPSAVTAAAVTFDDGERREVVHRDLRWNGTLVPIGSDRVPRLPIVEPATAEPPLALRLTEAYAYRLARPSTVGGRRVHVLEFAPRAGEGPHGRAFLDAVDFGLVRLETVRRGLPPPIVSSEQDDTFARTEVDGRAVWLPSRSEIHQTYEGPGHRTPIHRVVRYDRVEANPPDFAERRRRAHASDAVMMGETPQGFRYLAADPAGGERHPAGRGTAVRTVALGLTVDPNVDGVLPFGGLGYVDLDAFGRGAQVNAFVGPGFLQGALSLRLGRGWQAHAAGFAALVRYNDRAFDEGGEDYGRTVRQRPSRLSLGAARPLAARARLRLSYELEHNALARSELAATDFVTPLGPLAHGLRAEVELRRGPWTASASGSAFRRTRWEAWGRGTDEPPPDAARGYERYAVGLTRSLVLGPAATGRLEASWMGGHDLDRFSRYAIDSFLNRLRGYPAGSLRYDRGLLLRAQASAALRPGLRGGFFADLGLLHDPGYGSGLAPYPGTALSLELALPRGALLSAEAGVAFAGRDRDGRRGTRSLQVTAVKTF